MSLNNTQTVQRIRRASTGSCFKDICAACENVKSKCLCKLDDVRLLGDILKNDLTYLTNRLLRVPSESDLCGIDDQTKPHTCCIREAPKFLTSNRYITDGYRTSKSKERCIKGIFQWSNETVNIWTHLGPFLVMLSLYVDDILRNYDLENFSAFDKKLSAIMLGSYLAMLGLSSVYHIFNCCCSKCFRYWYCWDFVGVCNSIYAYGLGFLFLQFREHPGWIAFYGLIVTVIAGVPIGMTFSKKYSSKKYDDSRSVWIGGFVAFNFLPIVHSIVLRGGLSHPVVQATLPAHLIVKFLLVGSYIIYNFRFPERFMPGRVNYIGHSHQLWHIGTALSVFYARYLYFQYIRSFNGMETT